MNKVAAVTSADSGLNRALSFGVGLLLPLLTWQTAYIGTPKSLAERVVPVDALCLLLLALLFLYHRLRTPPLGALLYAGAALLSIVVVCLRFHAPDEDFWVAFAAIFMAFCFYLLGLNIGSSRVLVRSLLVGVLVSVLAEAVVVYHDTLFLPQWFPDPMEGRARGTFRASGQLAAFGFCGAGLLITFGWYHARRFAALFTGAGLVAASFVVMASRRSGIIGIVLWALLFLGVGARFHRRRSYVLFAGGVATAALGLLVFWEPISHSFVAQRMDEGLGGLGTSDGFIQAQWTNAMRTGPEWFPWGYGAGKGLLINRMDIGEHEVHNGLLAVLVEFGCAGLIGFLGMVLQPLFGRAPSSPTGREALLKMLIATFIVTSLVFMFHNTLYRDRAFLVYVGIAAAMAFPAVGLPPEGGGMKLVHIMSVPQSLSFLRGQVRYMKSRGFEVHAITSPGPALAAFGQEEGIATHSVDLSRTINPVGDLVALVRLVSLLRRIRPMIVQSHTPKGGLLGMIAAFLVGVPVRIYTLHGLPLETAHGLKRLLLRWTERISCLLAHEVIPVGPSLRRGAIDEGLASRTKMKVLGKGTINGVDAAVRFSPDFNATVLGVQIRRFHRIPPEARVIGYVGRLVRDKGLEDLMVAWHGLRTTFPDLHLLIVGAFEPRDPLSKEAEKVLRGDLRIHLTGNVDAVGPMYMAMDVVVLPTYREGFPTVPLEAAAMERPMVGTRVTGCVDAVVDHVTGTLVPAGDPVRLEEALHFYLAHPDVALKHGRAGRARVLRDFRQEGVWQAFEGEYRRLLNLKGRPMRPALA